MIQTILADHLQRLAREYVDATNAHHAACAAHSKVINDYDRAKEAVEGHNRDDWFLKHLLQTQGPDAVKAADDAFVADMVECDRLSKAVHVARIAQNDAFQHMDRLRTTIADVAVAMLPGREQHRQTMSVLKWLEATT